MIMYFSVALCRIPGHGLINATILTASPQSHHRPPTHQMAGPHSIKGSHPQTQTSQFTDSLIGKDQSCRWVSDPRPCARTSHLQGHSGRQQLKNSPQSCCISTFHAVGIGLHCASLEGPTKTGHHPRPTTGVQYKHLLDLARSPH